MNTDRFWLFDPEGDGFQTFATEAARDVASAEALKLYLASDGWAEEVELLSVGVITGRAQRVDIKRPVGKIDDECVDEDGVYWGDMIGAGCEGNELEMCQYTVLPLARPQKFESPVFGATRGATSDEVSRIEKLVTDCPVDVFGALSRALNARGLCLTIDAPEPAD